MTSQNNFTKFHCKIQTQKVQKSLSWKSVLKTLENNNNKIIAPFETEINEWDLKLVITVFYC
jgi:hypothetical protein